MLLLENYLGFSVVLQQVPPVSIRMTCGTEYFNTLLASTVDLCQLDKKAEPRNVLVIFSEPRGWEAQGCQQPVFV